MNIPCGSRTQGPSAQIAARPSLSSEPVTQTHDVLDVRSVYGQTGGSEKREWALPSRSSRFRGEDASQRRQVPKVGWEGHTDNSAPPQGRSWQGKLRARRQAQATDPTRAPSARLSGPALPCLPGRSGHGARRGRRGWGDRPGRRLPSRAFPGFCSGAALSSGPLGPGGLRARRATEHAKAGRPGQRARRGTCGGAGSAGSERSPPRRRRTRAAPLSRKAWKSRPVRSGPQQARSPRPGRPGPRCPGRSAPSSACPSRTRAARRSPARPPVALAASSALPGAGPAAAACQPRRAPPTYLPTWRPSAHAPRCFHWPGGGAGGRGRDALGALGLGSAQHCSAAGPPSSARVEAGPAPLPALLRSVHKRCVRTRRSCAFVNVAT